MRKEAGIYLFVGLLIAGAFLAIYYLNLGITGLVVFEQNDAAGFNEGTYQNVFYNESLSAVVLTANQTEGTYTSKVFDASGDASWDNLTFEGSEELDFEVTTCSDANCSDASFSSVDLNAMNLTGQYFQYRVNFDSSLSNQTLSLESVSIGSSDVAAPLETSVSISDPSGSKSSNSGLSLNFVVSGTDLNCWYEVLDATDSSLIKDNATLANCANVTFDLGESGDGSYVLNLYANGTSGFASGSSSFSVNVEDTSTEEEEEEDTEASTVQVPVIPSTQASEATTVTSISGGDVEAIKATPGSVNQRTWVVTNSGTAPLSACVLSIGGEFSSWGSVSDDAINLNAGDSHEFSFTITVPEDVADGSFSIGVGVDCAETFVVKTVTLNVEREKLGFEIIDAQRTRDDRVRVVYSLEELIGEDQDVVVTFTLLDSGNQEVGNVSQNRSVDANDTGEFTANININESLQGNFSLSATVNSEVYTTTVLEPITLGTPVGGFAIFGEGLGTGGYVVLVVVVIALMVAFVVARTMRKSGKGFKDLFVSGK